MATVKKGILTKSPEWWKHLKKFNKRVFWKRERRAARRDATEREHDDQSRRLHENVFRH